MDNEAVLGIFPPLNPNLWFVIKSTKTVSKQHAWITNSEPLQSIESANIAATAHIEMDVTLYVMCPKLSCVANCESCDGS